MGRDDLVGVFDHDGGDEGARELDELLGASGHPGEDVVVVALDDVRWEVVRLAAGLFVGDVDTQTDALDRLGQLLRIDQDEILTAANRLRPGTIA
ncbi:MAG: hypothetical protein RL338_1206 [Chloroflexota bacterium]|jgi:hypothetical protein